MYASHPLKYLGKNRCSLTIKKKHREHNFKYDNVMWDQEQWIAFAIKTCILINSEIQKMDTCKTAIYHIFRFYKSVNDVEKSWK